MESESDNPTAAVLIIGAEILSGKVEDQNGPFLIRALHQRGVELEEIRVLPDDVTVISNAIRAIAPRVSYLFTSGGIGPTHDDVTIEAVARALGRQVVRHPTMLAMLEKRYGEDLGEARRKLSEVPQGATLRCGKEELLPTIQVENVTIFPGVPSFLRVCFDRISEEIAGQHFVSRAVLINAAESDIADHLRDVQHAIPEVAVGSYPRFSQTPDDKHYRVKVTVDGRDAARVNDAIVAIKAGLDPATIVGELP